MKSYYINYTVITLLFVNQIWGTSILLEFSSSEYQFFLWPRKQLTVMRLENHKQIIII